MILKITNATTREVNTKSGIVYDFTFSNGVRASKVAIFDMYGSGPGRYSNHIDKLYFEYNKDVKKFIGQYVKTNFSKNGNFTNFYDIFLFDMNAFKNRIDTYDILDGIYNDEFELLEEWYTKNNKTIINNKEIKLDYNRYMLYPVELEPLADLMDELCREVFIPNGHKSDSYNSYTTYAKGFTIQESHTWDANGDKGKVRNVTSYTLVFNALDPNTWDKKLLYNYIEQLNSFKPFILALKCEEPKLPKY